MTLPNSPAGQIARRTSFASYVATAESSALPTSRILGYDFFLALRISLQAFGGVHPRWFAMTSRPNRKVTGPTSSPSSQW